ncbi:MAG: Ig-like domain-containing protein [Thermoanaerobaculia bacterium]|nr:Ig-like domain-containing protein [Thermoanaerobaculia bacterium]
MNQPKLSASSLVGRARRALGLASLVILSIPTAASAAPLTELPLRFTPIPRTVNAVPPLPTLVQFPTQLVLDDDSAEGTVGVAGATARQFLWFNRFSPGGAFDLEETWVLFPAGDNMAVGAAIQIAIYQDTDGNPANGATLLGTFDETIQAVDGNTFSIYSTPVSFDGAGDVLIGVVPRFIVSGVTTATGPAAIDTQVSQGRSWLAVWSTDPPNPPALTPLPDVSLATVDGFLPGNWLIRGFGTPPPVVTVPTVGEYGMILLALSLALAAAFVLGRRGRAVAGALLALSLAGAAQAQTTIDSFTTNQAALSEPPASVGSTATGGADIIGTRRGLVPRILAGVGPTTVSVAGGNLVFTVTATTPDSRGEARISWDGDTNALVLSPAGLGTQNLTTGNSGGFRVRVASTTAANAELVFTVHSGAGNSSRASRLLPLIGAATNVFIPFSEFRTVSGTGANFTSVGAIELTVRATEATVTLDEIATSAPTVTATKVDAQITDADGDTRVDPGDRLRYTITVTNTGNEALNVALADTIDSNTTLVAGSVSSTPIARNDQYLGVGNVTLNVDGTPPGLLANDSDPDGDTVTVQTITSPTAQGGTVSLVDAGTGTFTYLPPAGFKGVDSFTYTIVDDNANTSTATATITMDQLVWFVDDAHPGTNVGTLANPFVGILPGNLGGAGGAGDVDTPGDILFVFAGAHNGIELEADQHLVGEGEGLVLNSETIVPAGVHPVHTNGAGPGILLATNNRIRGVNIGNTSGAGISGTNFVNLDLANCSIGGTGPVLSLNTGALAAAFTALATTSSASTAISLTGVTGSLSSGGGTNLSSVTGTGILVSGGSAALDFGATGIGATAGGIDLAGGTTASVSMSSLAATTSAGFGLRATSGTINLAGVGNSIAATGGPAVDLTATSLGGGATFSNVSSTNSTGKGINLDTVTGSFTATGGAIANAGGISFDLNAGSSNVSYAGTISNIANVLLIDVTARTGGTTTFSGNLSSTSNGNGINVSSNTGGTINFSGATKTLNTGTDAAVTLATNTGATINFTGGGLDIDTTTGAGFNATGGAAAITVQGSGNSITSTTGTALNVASTTIGAADLTFQSIASNGGANGIVLNNTGSTGNLVVTGTGSAGSGGTVQNKATGISLTNTNAPSFSWMQLNDFGDFAIRGSSVVGFNLDNTVVSGSNGTDPGADEGSIRFTELTGSAAITNCNISGAVENNLSVINTTGSLNRLTVSGTTFGSMSAATGDDAMLVEGQNAAVVNVTVQNSTFTSARGDHFQHNLVNTATGDLVFTGNNLTNAHPAIVSGGGGIRMTGGGAGMAVTATFNISNNTMRDSRGTALAVNQLGGSGSYNGTISNNAIGVAAVSNSGSSEGSGIFMLNDGTGSYSATVTGNTVRQYGNFGIFMQTGGSGTVGSGTMKATITGNTVSNPGTLVFAKNGFQLNGGVTAGDTYQICLTLGGAGALRNTLVGSSTDGGTDFRLRQRQSTSVRLPGYAGANNDDAAVVTFVQNNNNLGGTPTGSATNTVPTGGGWLGGACPF